MKIFLTGAAGFIGGSIAHRLLAEGHTVRGLVRDAGKADALHCLGIQPVLGDLDNMALLGAEARASDAVINAASSDHAGAVSTILDALRGSHKPFLHTSGSSVIGDDVCGDVLSPMVFDESTPFIVEAKKQARHTVDNSVLEAAGVRGVVLCNTMIYGTGHGLHAESVQIPLLVAQARESGVARVVGAGINRWSNAHIDDVVELYLRALVDAPAGSFYFVENGEASYRDIGAAIARRLGLGPVQSWTVEAAAAVWGEGHARYSFGSNSRVRAVRARHELGWLPRHASVTDWIEREMPIA